MFWLDKGIYHVRILITGQEFNLNWFEFNTVVSDEHNPIDNNILIYPNPTDGKLIVSSTNNLPLEIKIHDLSGRLVMTTHESISDISMLKTGIYLLNISFGNMTYQQKIIKK